MKASAVVEHLVVNWNINPMLIAPSGRGEYFPVADNATPEGRAQNRRDEILVFEKNYDKSDGIKDCQEDGSP